jgi:hypothetical protein
MKNLYICNEKRRVLKISKANLDKIESLYKEQQYTIRYEKGNFNSGYCIVEAKKVVVINKFYDIEGRCNILLDILMGLSNIDEALFSEKSLLFFKSLMKSQEERLKDLVAS